MLYELRTYTFYPGMAEPYLAMWGSEILPLYDEIGVRVVGCWLPTDNPLNYVWLRVYDDDAERASKTNALRTRPEWPGISERIRTYESGAETRDFRPATFSTIDGAIRSQTGSGAEPFAIYQHRLVTTKPGMRDTFLGGLERDFIPLASEAGMTVLGPFLPTDADNQILSIWCFKTADEADLRNIRAHPRFRDVIGQFGPMEENVAVRTMLPTAFNPIGRYL
jgi:hypothetical protein